MLNLFNLTNELPIVTDLMPVTLDLFPKIEDSESLGLWQLSEEVVDDKNFTEGAGYSNDRGTYSHRVDCFNVTPYPHPSEKGGSSKLDTGVDFKDLTDAINAKVEWGVNPFTFEHPGNYLRKMNNTAMAMSINYFRYEYIPYNFTVAGQG